MVLVPVGELMTARRRACLGGSRDFSLDDGTLHPPLFHPPRSGGLGGCFSCQRFLVVNPPLNRDKLGGGVELFFVALLVVNPPPD